MALDMALIDNLRNRLHKQAYVPPPQGMAQSVGQPLMNPRSTPQPGMAQPPAGQPPAGQPPMGGDVTGGQSATNPDQLMQQVMDMVNQGMNPQQVAITLQQQGIPQGQVDQILQSVVQILQEQEQTQVTQNAPERGTSLQDEIDREVKQEQEKKVPIQQQVDINSAKIDKLVELMEGMMSPTKQASVEVDYNQAILDEIKEGWVL